MTSHNLNTPVVCTFLSRAVIFFYGLEYSNFTTIDLLSHTLTTYAHASHILTCTRSVPLRCWAAVFLSWTLTLPTSKRMKVKMCIFYVIDSRVGRVLRVDWDW